MKLLYTILFSFLSIFSSFAQHSLKFNLSDPDVNLKKGLIFKAPIEHEFISLPSCNSLQLKSDFLINRLSKYSIAENYFKSSILSSFPVIEENSNANFGNNYNKSIPIIECTFVAMVNAPTITDICPGIPAILTTQTGSGFTYQWLLNDEIIPGANAATFAAFQAGEYSVIIHTRNCKGESVPIAITVKDTTYFNPLQDTIKQCGGLVMLNAGNGFNDYNWNIGQLTQSITVNSTNKYVVSVMSTNGCLLKDSCFVSLIDDQIHQNNPSICSGSQVVLYVSQNNGISNHGISCSWLNGSSSNPLIDYPTQTTNYIVDISNGYGVCRDSINVNINQSSSSVQQASACRSYVWNGTTFTQSGIYHFTTTNSAGCDSLITLYLNVQQPVISTTNITACDSYNWYGNTYTTSGLYEHITANSSSCGNIEQLNLTINHSSESIEYASSCGSYVWNNQTYSTSGTYTYITSNVAGCDSVASLVLTINNPNSSITNVTAEYSYMWNGMTYFTSGTYVYMSTNVNGCDSIALLVLDINSNLDCTITASSTSICEGQFVILSAPEINTPSKWSAFRAGISINNISNLTYLWSDGETTSTINVTPLTTTTYTLTISNGITSCTNSITIFVNHSSASTESITSCGSYSWNGEVYTQSGSYIFTTTNAAGCDSVATLNLIINQVSTSTESITSCGSYSWNGEEYSQSGSYIFTTTNAAGCDSVATLNLIINQASASTESITSCGSYSWNGEVYSQSGSYIFTTTNAAGCDSVATLNLIINHSSASTESITSCGSYSWNGEEYTQSGSYLFTTTNAAGCDSVATLNLLIQSLSIIPDAIAPSTNSINAGESVVLNVSGGSLGDGAVWNWYKGYCGGTLVGTGNQISVSPLINTTYYVRAEGTCNNTECVSVSISVNRCGATGVTSNATNNVICNGSSVVLSVQGTPGLGGTWNWYKNGCGIGCVIGTGSSITVNPCTTTTYYVMSVGGQCGTTTCESITIYVNTAPHSPSVINGPAVVLCNGQSVIYSVIPVTGATSYTWTVPNGVTIISGQGTASIEVNFVGAIHQSGSGNCSSGNSGSSSICVKANNDCGSSLTTCFAVSTELQGTISISGPSTVVRNQIVSYTSSTLSGASIYTWSLPSGWLLLSGQGTTSIQVKTSSQSGNVNVTPSYVCGSGTAAYKYVNVIGSNGSCSDNEENKSLTNTVNTNLIPEIKAWPNPASDYIIIDAGSSRPSKIEILDRQGRLVVASIWKNKFDVSNLVSGYYFVKVYTTIGVKTLQVEVIR